MLPEKSRRARGRRRAPSMSCQRACAAESLELRTLLAVTVGPVSGPEGNAGTQDFTFTVNVTIASPLRPVSLDYSTEDGTAVAGADYLPVTGSMSFIRPGTRTVTVPVVGDAAVEPDETFSLVLTYEEIGEEAARATGTIVNDDAPPVVNISDTGAVESTPPERSRGLPFTISVSRLPLPGEPPVVVRADSSGGTATPQLSANDPAGDFIAVVAPNIIFTSTSPSSVLFVVPVFADANVEPDETVFVDLTVLSGGTVGDGHAVGVIRNDDFPPPAAVSIGNAFVTEPPEPGQQSFMTFPVTLSRPLVDNEYAWITYLASYDTASNDDFVSRSGEIDFVPRGPTTAEISVAVKGDTVRELNETFSVLLGGPENLVVAPGHGRGRGMILDEDGGFATTATLSQPSPVVEGDSGTTDVSFGIFLNQPFYLDRQIEYRTLDGTATAGQDYDGGAVLLTIPAFRTSVNFPVAVRGDELVEGDETFRVQLAGVEGQVVGPDAIVTIRDDDFPPVHVTDVFLNGTRWTAGFRNHLAAAGLGSATYGYSVRADDPLNELPWANVDQVSIRFDRDASVKAADLAVRGLRVPSYSVGGVSYDEASRTATWTLARPLASDKILLDLDGSAGGVRGIDTGWLDGDWAGAADAFPSGDGSRGGDFRFRLNVLPGDVNRTGAVTVGDVTDVLTRQASAPPLRPARYDAFDDLNGDGRINVQDLALVRRSMFTRLPSGEPASLAAVPALPPRNRPATRDLFGSSPILS
jgi:hypothetical protein